jgi:alpha-1,3-rhamnosyl/mannosyltransferase
MVRSMGLASRLTVLRNVPDLTDVYRRAQVLLFPSYYEGFGLPLVEAMSQGVPIIASNRTSVPEVMGDAGPVLPPDDTAAWVAALERLTDPDQYREASRRSYGRGQTFNSDRMRSALLAAYSVVSRR